jgi:ATP-dependent RNA helicase DDX1
LLACSKNGQFLGEAYTFPTALQRAPLFAACTVKNAELRFSFTDDEVQYKPEGYMCLGNAQNLTSGGERGGEKA